MTTWVLRGAEVLVWWCLLIGVWVLTLSSVSASDMAAAAGSALLCAIGAVAGREAVGGHWRPSRDSVRWFLRLPAVVLVDTARVLAVAARQLTAPPGEDPGELRRVKLTADATRPERAARQATAALVVSLTPGTYVADVDEENSALVVHSLVGGPSSMETAVSA